MLLCSVASSHDAGGESNQSDKQLDQSSTQHYATYSTFDQNGEFGIRTQKSPSLDQQDQANYAEYGRAQSFDTSTGIKESDSINTEANTQSFVSREVAPPVYGIPNESSKQESGYPPAPQSETYFTKATGVVDTKINTENSGSFTPVSLSVEEAFSKYFPTKKDDSQQVYASQQNTQQQQASSQQYAQYSDGQASNPQVSLNFCLIYCQLSNLEEQKLWFYLGI